MARTAIIFGLLLCGLTVAAMSDSTYKSPAQFVPMMFGVPLLFCGVVALNPHRRRLAMLTAVIIGGIGATSGGIRAVVTGLRWMADEPVNRQAWAVVVAMAIACAAFAIATAVALQWSRRRTASTATNATEPRRRTNTDEA